MVSHLLKIAQLPKSLKWLTRPYIFWPLLSLTSSFSTLFIIPSALAILASCFSDMQDTSQLALFVLSRSIFSQMPTCLTNFLQVITQISRCKYSYPSYINLHFIFLPSLHSLLSSLTLFYYF